MAGSRWVPVQGASVCMLTRKCPSITAPGACIMPSVQASEAIVLVCHVYAAPHGFRTSFYPSESCLFNHVCPDFLVRKEVANWFG